MMTTEDKLLHLRYLCSEVMFDFEMTQYLIDDLSERNKVRERSQKYSQRFQEILNDSYVPNP